MSRTSRTKGKVGERAVVAVLREYGIEAKRGWQSREGSEQADVEAPSLPLRIEVKAHKRCPIRAGIRQCKADAEAANDGRRQVVIWRDVERAGARGDPCSDWRIDLSLRDLLELLGHAKVEP